MRGLILMCAALLAASANADTFGPGTTLIEVAPGVVVRLTVPPGGTVYLERATIVKLTGVVDDEEDEDDDVIVKPTDEARVKRFRDAANAVDEANIASNLMALFAGLAQKSDPTTTDPLYTTPEQLQKNVTAGVDIFLLGSEKKDAWQTWRDLLTDEWVAVAQRGGDMGDYSKLMGDASVGLSREGGAERFDIGVVFQILEILGDPSKTRLQKIFAILPLILSLFAGGA